MDLKMKDVAELLQVSEKTIYRWIGENKIPAYRINHQYRFNLAEINEWVLQNKISVSSKILSLNLTDTTAVNIMKWNLKNRITVPTVALIVVIAASIALSISAGTSGRKVQPVAPSPLVDQIATAYNVKGRGLVVLTSCSHRGVINAVKQAQAASGMTKVHAVIGGFHLAPFKEDYIRETVAALKQADVDYIIPLHCSGEAFYDIAKSEMPTKVLRAYTGTQLTFG